MQNVALNKDQNLEFRFSLWICCTCIIFCNGRFEAQMFCIMKTLFANYESQYLLEK